MYVQFFPKKSKRGSVCSTFFTKMIKKGSVCLIFSKKRSKKQVVFYDFFEKSSMKRLFWLEFSFSPPGRAYFGSNFFSSPGRGGPPTGLRRGDTLRDPAQGVTPYPLCPRMVRWQLAGWGTSISGQPPMGCGDFSWTSPIYYQA